MEMNHDGSGSNHSTLLEGLFQLVVSGHTEGYEFTHLDAEIYERLDATYNQATPMRPAGMR